MKTQASQEALIKSKKTSDTVRNWIYNLILNNPTITSNEIAKKYALSKTDFFSDNPELAKKSSHSTTGRCAELRERGLIYVSGKRGGYSCYRATPIEDVERTKKAYRQKQIEDIVKRINKDFADAKTEIINGIIYKK